MKEFDYEFMEIRYILCSLIPVELKEYDEINEKYDKSRTMIELFITQDKEIVEILTSKKDFNIVVNEVLELNKQRLLKKEPFHRYIEKYYPDIEYSEYENLFLYYQKLTEEYKKEAKEVIEQHIIEAVEYNKNTTKMNLREIDPLILRSELIQMFENTIKETRALIEKINDGKEDFDRSMLNFLDDYAAVWIGSLRATQQNTKILIAFINNSHRIEVKKGKYGWYFEGLTHSLSSIMRINKEKTVDNYFFIAHEILRAFDNNKEMAKAICCQKCKINGVERLAIMDKRTFYDRMKSPLFKEFGLTPPK